MASFKTGHKKLGGRKAGSKNKRTLARRSLEEILISKNVDPLKKLLDLLRKGDLDDKTKAYLWKDLLEFLYPKLKAIDFKMGEEERQSLTDLVKVLGDK